MKYILNITFFILPLIETLVFSGIVLVVLAGETAAYIANAHCLLRSSDNLKHDLAIMLNLLSFEMTNVSSFTLV